MSNPHRQRYEPLAAVAPTGLPRVAGALRACLAEGYNARDLRADLLSGLVVGIVALPLSMALAIASGVRPENGLYTAIIAGFVIALLGGSRYQVSGPTAAFVVILAPVAGKFGLAGLALATVLAGLLLIAMGLLRLGRLIEFVPYPVTTGFTAGIAVVIATLQLKDLLGLSIAHMPDGYVEKVIALWEAGLAKFTEEGAGRTPYSDVIVGVGTLILLLAWPRITRRVPAALIALPVAAAGAYLATRYVPGFSVKTIATQFGGIPQTVPMPVQPWNLSGPSGPQDHLTLSTATVKAIISAAFAIAMLGAIESLLSAVVADGMTGKKHDPDAELLAQGVGNVVAPFFGGFAATGAIARTSTNIRSGARSPVAAMTHAVFLLASMLALAPLLQHLPMAAMAALLLVVARNMAEVKHVAFLLRFAPRSDVIVLLACFGLTVVFDMVVAVSFGFVLAAILFMRRMAEVSRVQLLPQSHPAFSAPLPGGVLLLEVTGPLFFGAAAKALSTLTRIDGSVKAVILDLESVPTIDATGLVNLDAASTELQQRGVLVVLAAVQSQPARVFEKSGWNDRGGLLAMAGSVPAGVEMARAWVEAG